MNEHTTVSAKQLCTLVFLSLAVDMAVRPFTSGGSAGAQIAILAAVLNTAVVSILLLPVLGLLRREAFTTLKGGVTFGSKALLTLSAVLFAAGGAAAMVRSEAFFRYVSEPMPQLLVYGLFLLVVFYALRCGLESIVRVLGLAAGLFLLSMALMLVSNLGGMHLSNLTFQPFDFPEVLRTAARGFTLPPELPLFCLLSLHANREKRRPLLKTLALLCVFYIGLTFCSEAVLGMKAQLQQQTIHTLSRLGSISVFRRLDALHIAAWMLAELCKVAALAYGVQSALTPLLPHSQRGGKTCGYAVGLLAVLLAVCAGAPPETLRAVLTAGTAVLLACTVVYGCVMEGFYAKKRV